MYILGIESSHDDTSIALMKNNSVLKMISFSQIKIHEKFGGTVPEIASREHVNNISLIISELKNYFDFNKIDLIAYTAFPGLIGSLQIGFLCANALSLFLEKELIPVDHLKGHLFSALIDKDLNEIEFPIVGFVVSGGHSQLYLANDFQNIKIIGRTNDDALGEVYDKIARKLELGFPGGPLIDKISQNIKTQEYFTFPQTKNKYDFSFSGLKTQVINKINNLKQKEKEIDNTQIAADFQNTAIKYVIQKINLAIKDYNPKSFLLGGGVSANYLLRQKVKELKLKTFIPEMKYATDNGAMIAFIGYLEKKN